MKRALIVVVNVIAGILVVVPPALLLQASAANAATPGPVLYAATGRNVASSLYILNPATGAVVSTVGPIGFAVTGLAVDPTTGILYGATSANSPVCARCIITINRTTGAGTLVGSENLSSGSKSQVLADITFTSDGQLYGWAEPNLDLLVSVNKSTGAATVIGPSGGSDGSGLAANGADVLYFTGSGDDGELNTVSRTTGEFTSAVTLNGTRENPINALTFACNGTTLYGNDGIFEGSLGSPQLITIDTSTGAVTTLGPTPDATDALAWFCGAQITTQASAGGPAGSTAVTDTATLTGGFIAPTGTVSFKLFSNAGCTNQVGATSTKAVSGPSVTSNPITPTAPGTYFWTASYSGDANNPPDASPCQAPNESVVLTAPLLTISTQSSAGGVIGTAVTDTATLAGGTNPTGSVTFKLFSNNNCATQVGATSTKTLSGLSATSDPITPPAPGTYYWTAAYSGDANNGVVASSCNAPNESVVITKATPAISTQASPGNLLGAPVRDTATVSGGFNPTGTVTFRLFSNNNCGTEVFNSTKPLGNPIVSDWFTPTAAGTYYWIATYNGDTNNNTAAGSCTAANESVVIAPFVAPGYTRIISGDTLGPVTVTAGESVLIQPGARVVGPVTVQPGGALTVVNAQISRGIVVDNPSFLSICGSDVSAPSPATALSVSNAAVPIRIGDPANGCAANRFAGQVTLTANLATTFGSNAVSGTATVNNGGPGNTVIKANTVFGTLACAGNNPAPTNAGQTNSASSKTGQCSGL